MKKKKKVEKWKEKCIKMFLFACFLLWPRTALDYPRSPCEKEGDRTKPEVTFFFRLDLTVTLKNWCSVNTDLSADTTQRWFSMHFGTFFCARVDAVWVNTASCEGRENLFTPSSFLEGEVSAAVGSRWMFLFAWTCHHRTLSRVAHSRVGGEEWGSIRLLNDRLPPRES